MVKATGALVWIEAGIQILSRPQFISMKLDHLSAEAQLSKGSFYHHFRSMAEFEEQLLAEIRERFTLRLFREIDSGLSPDQKMFQLSRKVRDTPFFLAVNIRRWALTNGRAWAYQREIDETRMTYVKALLMESGITEERARILAQTRYVVYVGMEYFAFHYPVTMEDFEQIEEASARAFGSLLSGEY